MGQSADGGARMNILTGTLAVTRDRTPLSQITIQQVADPGADFPDANFKVAGLCYAFEPTGAQFNPAITITLTYDPAQVPAGQTPFIAWWNAQTRQWEILTTVSFDPVNHTVTASTTHFTAFAVLTNRIPATSSPATTTAAVTSAPVVSPVISNPLPSELDGSAGKSDLGLIIGLSIGCLVLLLVIIFLLRRKPQKDNSKK